MDKLRKPIIYFLLSPSKEHTTIVFFDNPSKHTFTLIGPQRAKTSLWVFANSKGADQPAQSDQCLCYSEVYWKVSYLVLQCTISISLLVSVAEQVGLNITLSETQKTSLLALRLNKKSERFSCVMAQLGSAVAQWLSA